MSGSLPSFVWKSEKVWSERVQPMNAISRMLDKVRATILRQGVSVQDADDIVQEAFARLEAYTRAHQVRSREAFLVTTAVNISRDQGRRRRHSGPVGDGPDVASIADVAPLPEEHARLQERLRRVAAGLARLDPLTRRCLVQQRIEGLTFPQVAEREGLSVAAVEKRVARALVFLARWTDGW